MLRVMAPILPFVTDHLWRNLVLDGPASVHLAGWPDVPQPDRVLLDEIAAVRRVVPPLERDRVLSTDIEVLAAAMQDDEWFSSMSGIS